MNTRIAKKILTCISILHTDPQKVLKARNCYFDNKNWFIKKGLYLFPIKEDGRMSLPLNRVV